MSETLPLSYHAARLLILIDVCGKQPKNANFSGVRSRTLLAKLDFFVRYPSYLNQAAHILNKPRVIKMLNSVSIESNTVESKMIRYRYGPWDHEYYAIISYLVSKELLSVLRISGTDVFVLSDEGKRLALSLANAPEYEDVSVFATAIAALFPRQSGNQVKEFIYKNFPDIVHLRSGSEIQ